LLLALCVGCTAAGWFLFHGGLRSLFRSGAPAVASATPNSGAGSVIKANPEQKGSVTPRPAEDDSARQKTPPNKPVPPPAGGNNDKPRVTFEKQILPLFQTKCIGCHGSQRRSAGLDVRTLASLKKGGDSGPVVVRGEPNRSVLWEEVGSNRMPPTKNNKLSASEKQLIKDWIAAGLE
jgi:hypothetical protein